MTTPRSLLVDPAIPMFYHLSTHCTYDRLSGIDPATGKDYSYRAQWLHDRMLFLARCFSLEIHAYAIMRNHFHLVVYYDPAAACAWSDEEVIDRWLVAYPSGHGGEERKRTLLRQQLLASPEAIAYRRRVLGSMSMFMKALKQPIAAKANKEDGTSGHFFEQRFYSGALLDDDAVLAAMAYVDLNPIRARIARSIEAIRNASIAERLASETESGEHLKSEVGAIVSGLSDSPEPIGPRVSLRGYLELLRDTAIHKPGKHSSAAIWRSRVQLIGRRQRAHGPPELLSAWLSRRGLRNVERAMPA